jgi:hypothetical protein
MKDRPEREHLIDGIKAPGNEILPGEKFHISQSNPGKHQQNSQDEKVQAGDVKALAIRKQKGANKKRHDHVFARQNKNGHDRKDQHGHDEWVRHHRRRPAAIS